MIPTRPATPADAPQMNALLADILDNWGSDRPRGVDHVIDHYISHPDSLSCTVALADDGRVIGFQSMRLLKEGNPFGVPAGWGFIGTYVSLTAGRNGTGRALFEATKVAAIQANVIAIDATIGKDNAAGLGYYEAIGFRTYRTSDTAISKRFDISSAA